MKITAAQARRWRLVSLLLAANADETGPTDVAGVARWFGAMQSQDLGSGLWSFGVRLPGLTQDDVSAAVARGEVLRTWPMRGTLHFVAAEDARWLLATTGVKAMRGAARRRAFLGLEEATVDLAAEVAADRLSDGRPMTRAALLAEFEAAGISSAGQNGYHLLWYVSQLGITCVGPNEGNEQTFVLLSSWAPEQRDLSGDAALAELALRFVRSHGPAPRTDFAGWAGITQTEAKTGLASAGQALVTADVDGTEMWLAADLPDRVPTGAKPADGTLALPGFDEFILGYKNRSLQLPAEHADAIVPGGNGVFRPTIVVDGVVTGTWRRTVRSRRVVIEPDWFSPPSARARGAAETAFADYARFLGLEPEVRAPA